MVLSPGSWAQIFLWAFPWGDQNVAYDEILTLTLTPIPTPINRRRPTRLPTTD